MLDYYLISKCAERYINNTHIGHMNSISDQRPIFITITPATLALGKGFWRFDNSLLKDADFVNGFNHMNKTTMKRYSLEQQGIEDSEDVYKLGLLKKCLQDLIDQNDKDAAPKILANTILRGRNPQGSFTP